MIFTSQQKINLISPVFYLIDKLTHSHHSIYIYIYIYISMIHTMVCSIFNINTKETSSFLQTSQKCEHYQWLVGKKPKFSMLGLENFDVSKQGCESVVPSSFWQNLCNYCYLYLRYRHTPKFENHMLLQLILLCM